MKKEDFEGLVSRLEYWNRGAGVNDHCTAGPIFEVQEKKRRYGIDMDYCSTSCLITDDGQGEIDPNSYYDELEEEDQAAMDKESQDRGYESFKEVATEDDARDIIQAIDSEITVTGYHDEWVHVNTHLTREGAEAFIKRKKHDHGELRIYVGSLYWCAEFQNLIHAMLDGEVVFNEKKEI